MPDQAAARFRLNSWGVLFAGVLLGTHFSPFYDYALRHPDVHEFIEHPLYLGVALLYYYPLLDAQIARSLRVTH